MAGKDPALQDGPEDEGKPGGTARFFTEEELNAAIESARKQEKDKLYPTISKTDERAKAMESELRELRAFQKKQEKSEADRQAAVEAERRKAEEAELSAKDLVARRDAEYQARLQELQAENDGKLALMAKEIEFNRLQAYTQRRVNEESDEIAPELLDFVGGNTPEEVEASIDRVKAKTTALLDSMKSAGVRARAAMPGVSGASGSGAPGPLDTGNRELSAGDIQGMGMREYAELRRKIGIAGAQNQGLFRQ